MKILRTPDSRFENLKDYPFTPHYVDVNGLRMHVVDEGPADADPILLLHGEPSWSYLYRYMIPILVDAGFRVLAPDLIGFGKSDKPARVEDYSYQSHMDWMTAFLNAQALTRITLFCQDWGSLIGLRLAAEYPDQFDRIVVGNGMLPTGDQPMPGAFRIWRQFARYSPWFPVDRIVDAGCLRKLDTDERRAYRAPFPSRRYKSGARAFPRLVPISPNDPASPACRRAWEGLARWEKPFLTLFSNGDPITRGGDRFLIERIPGAAGQPHHVVRGGHFLQEDAGPELAERIVSFVRATSPA